jgi:parallel beta-helix repeat protein
MSDKPCSKQTASRGAMKTLRLMLGMSMTLLAAHQAWAANITRCPITISQPGHYHVRTDLTYPAGTAISIEANDVQLHLNGHTLSGNGTGLVGVLVSGSSRVSVVGDTATNFAFNVVLLNSSDSNVVNVDASNSVVPKAFGNAITVQSSTDNRIINCTANGSNIGILLLVDSDNNTLIANTAQTNAVGGIAIQDFSDNNTVRANDVEHNPVGISVADETTGNLLQANRAWNNTSVDMSDGNANCDSNVWQSNQFGTANRACIQ